MDSKHQENHIKKYDEKSLEKLQSKLVFNDPAYLFIFKKTEKIVAALYLITNLVSDIEPIKWQIRKISLGLMSDMLTLKRLSSVGSKQTLVGIVTTISEIISLLKIASISDHISPMNYSMMQKELAMLIDSLQGLHLETIGSGALVLSEDFFNVPAPTSSQPAPANFPVASMFQNNIQAAPRVSSKGQYRTPSTVKDKQIPSAPKDNQKDSRHEKILQLLKAGKPLGIKDFAREIKDCSEKTIQRELLAMVENGVLKKTGERRWSLYSLV